MNVLLFDTGELRDDGTLDIRDQRLAHLRVVQRVSPGDRLRVGRIGGQLGEAAVIAIDTERARLHIDRLDTPAPPPAPLTLVIALPRPKMLKRILVDATTHGVKRICFTNAYRVEKSFWSSPLLAPEAIAEKCRLGLAQAIDTALPDVTLHPRFRPFVEDELPAIVAGSTALVAHPSALASCPHATTGHVTLAIGPEGGFIPFEVDLLERAAGFRPVSLGPRVLRVDTAVASLLGRLL